MCPDDKKEVSLFVNEYLPEIREQAPDAADGSIYKLMRSAVSFTTASIQEQDFNAVKKCMVAIDKLYQDGNRMVQNAIENVYVYSLRSLLHCINHQDQKRVHDMIPAGLHDIYVHQLQASYP